MKIGVAQIDCKLGEISANLSTILEMVQRAAEAGCDLVVLPEMADTGYDMGAIHDHAAAWTDGPCRILGEAAARQEIAVVCGLSERDEGRVYNTVALFDRSGTLVAKYRKTHLFSVAPVCEDQFLARGSDFVVAELGTFKAGLAICYDIRFPEMMRSMALGGMELLLVVAAWPQRRIEHWRLLNAARAIENQVFVAAANRVGTDRALEFGGSSCILDPFGNPLAMASETEQELIVAEISRESLDRTRVSMRVFEDRRPDLYRGLGGP